MIFFPSRVLAICTGAEAEVVVAAADGTIHEAHVKSLSPVHGHREKQKQKALFRSAPKNCPSRDV